MRKIRVIINQAARRGGRDSLASSLREEFKGFDLDIRVPGSYVETFAACNTASEDGVTDLVVVGGDGTVNLAVNAIAGSAVRLGIVPSGTANDLASYLGLPKTLPEACAVIKRAQTRQLDLVDVNGQLYATAGGMGVVSRVAADVNRIKSSSGLALRACRLLGSLVYVLYSFVVLLFGRKLTTNVDVSCDGKSLGKFRSVALFVNNQPTIGKTVMPCPDAKSDDGALAGLLMDRRSRLGTIFTVILMSLRGRHRGRRDVVPFAGEEISIRSETPTVFIGDGEVLANTRNLRLKVVPNALRVII